MIILLVTYYVMAYDRLIIRSKSTDPNQPGYTYEGLNEKESREMIQWRPLLDGLAEGVISQARNNIGAFGCIIPRASLLALRAILLRHGHLFTVSQLTAIFQYTILPAFQEAAERDTTPVVHIVSESPSISNIDFLATPLPYLRLRTTQTFLCLKLPTLRKSEQWALQNSCSKLVSLI